MKKLLKYIIAFTILIIIFNLLLFLSSIFPSSLIEKNVKESSERLNMEGNLTLLSHDLMVTNNNYTDSIMINACYSIDNKNPINSYLTVRKNFKDGLTVKQLGDTHGELISISSTSTKDNYNPVEELSEFLSGKVNTSIEYARYWHGYLPFLRVALIFGNITEIRLFIFLIFIILFAILILLLKKKLGITISIIFAFSLIAYDYFFVSYSLEGAPIFIVMMLACIVLLAYIEKFKNIYFYLFIIGCISNFVDFLTVPCITYALPLFIYLLYQNKQKQLNLKTSLMLVIGSLFSWGCGYSITWITKWIIYDVINQKDLIMSAISQILYRTSSTNSRTTQTIDVILMSFFIKYIVYYFIFISILFFASLCISRIYRMQFTTSFINYLKNITPILIVMLIPIAWYIVLSNHTVLHAHFVYKHMLIVLIGSLICLKNAFIYVKLNKKSSN